MSAWLVATQAPVAAATGSTAPTVVLVANPGGYWLVSANGAVFALGDAPYLGEGQHLERWRRPRNASMGIAAASNTGYWLVGQNGVVDSFGTAPYLGEPNTLNSGAGPGTSVVASPLPATGTGKLRQTAPSSPMAPPPTTAAPTNSRSKSSPPESLARTSIQFRPSLGHRGYSPARVAVPPPKRS